MSNNDHKGKPISPNETDETIVLAWEITPGRSIDSVIIRDYGTAGDYACGVLEERMDDADEDDLLKIGVTVNVKLIKISVIGLKELAPENEL